MDEYEAAIQAHNEAQRVFHAVRARFRSRRADDSEFLAAVAKYEEATRAFDVAFRKAQEIVA